MATFVVYAERKPDVLARVVMLLHRRAVLIDSLTLEHAESRDVVRMTIKVEVDGDQARRIEANLYKLVHVLLVEMNDRVEDTGPQKVGGITSEPVRVTYVVTTGGTIEKVYSEQTGSVANLHGKIDRYLRFLRLPDSDVRLVPLLNKDSLEMTDSDRHMILGTVNGLLPEQAPILITHGTDTMVQTGVYLQRSLPVLEIPIVLTGAMTPLGFEGSDGLQNLTESLFAVRILSPGIYVVSHNRVFPISKVRKDQTAGRFVWADEKPA